jgi:hypothetical protein
LSILKWRPVTERLEQAEVLGDLAELVADLDGLRHEVGRDLEEAVVEVAGDERDRAVDGVLDAAVRELRGELLDDEARRVVRAVRHVDDDVGDRTDGAGRVRRDVEVAGDRERAFRRERHRLRVVRVVDVVVVVARHVGLCTGGAGSGGEGEREEGDAGRLEATHGEFSVEAGGVGW